jgi:hypothetical protein
MPLLKRVLVVLVFAAFLLVLVIFYNRPAPSTAPAPVILPGSTCAFGTDLAGEGIAARDLYETDVLDQTNQPKQAVTQNRQLDAAAVAFSEEHFVSNLNTTTISNPDLLQVRYLNNYCTVAVITRFSPVASVPGWETRIDLQYIDDTWKVIWRGHRYKCQNGHAQASWNDNLCK